MLLYAAISKISCLLENISPINLGFLKTACVIASCRGPTVTLLLCKVTEQPFHLLDRISERIPGFAFSNSRFQVVRGLFANVCHTFTCAKKIQNKDVHILSVYIEGLRFCP